MSNRVSWIMVGVLAIIVVCLVLGIVGGGAYWLRNANQLTQATPTVPRRPTKIIEFPTDQTSCEAAGGKWGRIGLAPTAQCNLPTSDAGAVCSDSDECEGLCIADLPKADQERLMRDKAIITTTGKCAPWRITVGCIAVVEQGKVKGIMCID